MQSVHGDVRIVPVDLADDAALTAWATCASRVFTTPAPTPESLGSRQVRFAGHRLSAGVDGEATVATFRSFDMGLDVPGGRLLANAISSVTVLPTHRRRGLLTRWMLDDLRRAADAGAPASILIASQAPIYGRFGFGAATDACTWTLQAGAAFLPRPAGTVRIVEAEEFADRAPAVYERARRRQPGAIDRNDTWWQATAQLRHSMREPDPLRVYAVHHGEGGDVDGTLVYRIRDEWDERVSRSRLEVTDLVAADDAAYADLWRYASEVDLVTAVVAQDRSPAEPLPWLLADPRAARSGPVADFLWVRLHDVPAALSARRYPVPGRLVLEVVDPLADAVGGRVAGRWLLDVAGDGRGTCSPTGEEPDVTLPADTLAALWLGGVRAGVLTRAGRLSGAAAAVALLDATFSWPDPAWCGTWF